MQVLDNLETALQEGVANVFGLGMKIWLFEKDRWSFEWLVGFFASICVVLVGPRGSVHGGGRSATLFTGGHLVRCFWYACECGGGHLGCSLQSWGCGGLQRLRGLIQRIGAIAEQRRLALQVHRSSLAAG